MGYLLGRYGAGTDLSLYNLHHFHNHATEWSAQASTNAGVDLYGNSLFQEIHHVGKRSGKSPLRRSAYNAAVTFEGENPDGVPSLYQVSGILCAQPFADGNWRVRVRESNQVFEVNVGDGDFFRLQVRFTELYRHAIPRQPIRNPLLEWLAKGPCY